MILSASDNQNFNRILILKISVFNKNLINFLFNKTLKILVKEQWNQQMFLIEIKIARLKR